MAPMLGACVCVYTLVCVMDGLVFSSGRMAFAAGSQVINLPIVAGILAMSSRANLGLVGIWGALLCLFTLRLAENGAIMWRDFGPRRDSLKPHHAAAAAIAIHPSGVVGAHKGLARRSWNAHIKSGPGDGPSPKAHDA